MFTPLRISFSMVDCDALAGPMVATIFTFFCWISMGLYLSPVVCFFSSIENIYSFQEENMKPDDWNPDLYLKLKLSESKRA